MQTDLFEQAPQADAPIGDCFVCGGVARCESPKECFGD